MPNQRKPGQTFIGCQVDEHLLAMIDEAKGRKDRSFFLREAIAEKLVSQGLTVSEDLVYPPARSGNTMNVTGHNVTASQKNFPSPSVVLAPQKGAKYPTKKKATSKRGRKKPEK
jgi:hypothetical protein